jgi:hypothetical protein
VGFNWVKARSECSIERVFQLLAEVIDSDVQAANALKRSGVTFHVSRQAIGKIIVARDRDLEGMNEIHSVVFQWSSSKITARRANAAEPDAQRRVPA